MPANAVTPLPQPEKPENAVHVALCMLKGEATSKEKDFHAFTVSFLFISQSNVLNSAARPSGPSYKMRVIMCANLRGGPLQ